MTTNDDMNPRQPDEDEPIEDLVGDVLDLVDKTVARITDAEVDEHLRKVLSQSGYTEGLPSDLWRSHKEAAVMFADQSCSSTGSGKSPEGDVIAKLTASLREYDQLTRINAERSRLRLRESQKVLDAAREKTRLIIAAARDEGLNVAARMIREAREQAAQIVSDAREQANGIIDEAHIVAYQIKTAARNRNQQPDQVLEREYSVFFPGKAGPPQISDMNFCRHRELPLPDVFADTSAISTFTRQEEGVHKGGGDQSVFTLHFHIPADMASPDDSPVTLTILAARASDTPAKNNPDYEQENQETIRSPLEAWQETRKRVLLGGPETLPPLIEPIQAPAFHGRAKLSVIPTLSDPPVIFTADQEANPAPRKSTPWLPELRIWTWCNSPGLPDGCVLIEYQDKCTDDSPTLELES
jgi:vacuolar-type H+-ATPase subunit H